MNKQQLNEIIKVLNLLDLNKDQISKVLIEVLSKDIDIDMKESLENHKVIISYKDIAKVINYILDEHKKVDAFFDIVKDTMENNRMIQEEERRFTNQLIEQIDEDGNTYFDFIK